MLFFMNQQKTEFLWYASEVITNILYDIFKV